MPILSICIPTKNRAKYLDYTLTSIVRQKRFIETDDVEVIVSDNGSTDNTEEVCKKFPIYYTKMDEPTFRAEPNFLNVLKYGTGDFLKLHNDNMLVDNGGLDKMIEVIDIWKASLPAPVLFFANNSNFTKQNTIKYVGFDPFIANVSYMCTWIGGFGIWKGDLPSMEKIFLRNKDTLLCQVDMLREMISVWNRDVVVCNKFIFGDMNVKKGGLNIAEIFGQNYLNLIVDYVGLETFQKEKEKLLKELIIPHYFNTNKEDNNFERTGFFKYMKHYWNDKFFYEEIEKLLMENNHAE